MVTGCERAANDVIKICICQFQSFCNFFRCTRFRVHLATGCFQVRFSVNSKCKISKRNSNLFRSVLEREKSENLKINSRIRSWFTV